MKISASIPTIIIMLFAFASVHAKLGASHDIVDDAIDETLDPIYVGEGDERLLEENRELQSCQTYLGIRTAGGGFGYMANQNTLYGICKSRLFPGTVTLTGLVLGSCSPRAVKQYILNIYSGFDPVFYLLKPTFFFSTPRTFLANKTYKMTVFTEYSDGIYPMPPAVVFDLRVYDC